MTLVSGQMSIPFCPNNKDHCLRKIHGYAHTEPAIAQLGGDEIPAPFKKRHNIGLIGKSATGSTLDRATRL